MSMIRTVFLGTPAFAEAHLQSLIDDEHYDVVGVISQPDRPSGRHMRLTASPVKQLAESHGIPVMTPETVKDQRVLQSIAYWKAELAVVVAYGQILPKAFLDLFPRMVVNVHGSLLPRWRGAAPIQRALMAGDEISGVSLQVMFEKLDAGPVIGERKFELKGHDALTAHDKMMELGRELLEVDLMDYVRGNLAAQPQNESLVTYAPKIEKSEGQIHWNLSAMEIFNRLQGLKLGPGSFTHRLGKKLKIHRVEVVSATGKPGTVIEMEDEYVVIATGDGGLRVLEIQPESKPKMSVSAYLKGHPIEVGEVWGE
ncbi:MAG: methionyl-tRNA formyltransferase [Bdellovibrionales bacterium]|nr:methionyl-tRNA formyltransferase [Bdellovibrionales bacterium]